MKFSIERADVKGGVINIERDRFYLPVQVVVADKAAPKLKEKHFPYAIEMLDGSTKRLYFFAHNLDPVPRVQLEDERIYLAPPLKKLASFFAVLPLGMFLSAGILPTLIGFIVVKLNFLILRSTLSGLVKWGAIYALSISARAATELIAKLIWR